MSCFSDGSYWESSYSMICLVICFLFCLFDDLKKYALIFVTFKFQVSMLIYLVLLFRWILLGIKLFSDMLMVSYVYLLWNLKRIALQSLQAQFINLQKLYLPGEEVIIEFDYLLKINCVCDLCITNRNNYFLCLIIGYIIRR